MNFNTLVGSPAGILADAEKEIPILESYIDYFTNGNFERNDLGGGYLLPNFSAEKIGGGLINITWNYRDNLDTEGDLITIDLQCSDDKLIWHNLAVNLKIYSNYVYAIPFPRVNNSLAQDIPCRWLYWRIKYVEAFTHPPGRITFHSSIHRTNLGVLQN